MMKVPELTELEEDLLLELFNLGVGRAANSLSQLVQKEVLLSVPEVSIDTTDQVVADLDSGTLICGISQEVRGPFDARAMLVFPEQGSLEVVGQMLGGGMPEEMVAELQQEAFTEIGNIVLNACIASISNTLDGTFEIDVPQFCHGSVDSVFSAEAVGGDNISMLIYIHMRLRESEITGHLAFLLSSDSLQQLHHQLAKIVYGVTGEST